MPVTQRHIKIEDLRQQIIQNLGYNPTPCQSEATRLLAEFIYQKPIGETHPMFLLKGYAGTGKTSLVSALVKASPSIGIDTVLLAPTGRAAKVLSNYSGKQAFTIHKKIYYQKWLKSGKTVLSLRQNQHKSTLFIIDEASMIQTLQEVDSEGLFPVRNLLDDVMRYVYSSNCRLLLVGDTAQLPPVGMIMSPALDLTYLSANFPVAIANSELTDVVRQEQESGILLNATRIRQRITDLNFTLPIFTTARCPDIAALEPNYFEELLTESIHRSGIDSVVVITRSNKSANLFNRAIRNRILFRENKVNAGDLLMVVRNNYFWIPPDSPQGFIANGDIIEVLRVKRFESLYGFNFAEVAIRMVDYEDMPELEVRLLLETLETDTPALSPEQNQLLFGEVMKDYGELNSQTAKLQAIRSNEWMNALQVKYAYALTCHKTQGGQWSEVYIDHAMSNSKPPDRENLRWLYTAVTRATKKVYLVNFPPEYFVG